MGPSLFSKSEHALILRALVLISAEQEGFGRGEDGEEAWRLNRRKEIGSCSFWRIVVGPSTRPSKEGFEGLAEELRSLERHGNLQHRRKRGASLEGKWKKWCEIFWFWAMKQLPGCCYGEERSCHAPALPKTSPADRCGEWVCSVPSLQDSAVTVPVSPVPKARRSWWCSLLTTLDWKRIAVSGWFFPSVFFRVMSFFCICVVVWLCLPRVSKRNTINFFFMLTSQYYWCFLLAMFFLPILERCQLARKQALSIPRFTLCVLECLLLFCSTVFLLAAFMFV